MVQRNLSLWFSYKYCHPHNKFLLGHVHHYSTINFGQNVCPYTSRCSMKDIRALSSNIHPRIGGMSVREAASTLFAVHNSRRLVEVKWKLLRSGSAPGCPSSVYLMSLHVTITYLSDLTPPYYHSLSAQRLEVGTALEQCFHDVCQR